MTKEELEKEAIEYVCKENPLVIKGWFIEAFKKYDKGEKVKYLKDCEIAEYEAYLAGAEPREKRIQIDAKQIRALQKQNGELTDKVNELEAQIEKMKCCENCRYCNKWGEANSNSPNCKKCNWVSNWKLRR